MPLKFAANLTFMFTELPFPARFAAAAKAGFDGVEFLFPYGYPTTEIAALVKDAGVTLVLHNAPPGNWDVGDRGIAAVPGRQLEFRASIETALRYADATGLSQIHIMAGRVDNCCRADAEAVYVENLGYAAARFAEAGITVLIEPINNIDMPGYFLNYAHEAQRIIKRVDAPNLRLQFDCYHSQIMDGEALLTLRANFDQIAHIQIASIPDRQEPDQGNCNYATIFAELEQLNYSGWIGCEYHPRGRTVDGLSWLPSAYRARVTPN